MRRNAPSPKASNPEIHHPSHDNIVCMNSYNEIKDMIEEAGGDMTLISQWVKKNCPWFLPEIEGLPTGWVLGIGAGFMHDMMLAYANSDINDGFTIVQIKEKFGALDCYMDDAPDVMHTIASIYRTLSSGCCISCGTVNNVNITGGWIEPMCSTCIRLDGTIRNFRPVMMDKPFKSFFEYTVYGSENRHGNKLDDLKEYDFNDSLVLHDLVRKYEDIYDNKDIPLA